ncbi:MAG: ankyrin repeat domain-containing protein [Bdellovibrionales bacterium]|nr:ankyrin repeat domain-containing protein [Bdellovibrionales bacterium]
MNLRIVLISSFLVTALLVPVQLRAENSNSKSKFITDLDSAKAERRHAEREAERTKQQKKVELSELSQAAKSGKLSELVTLIGKGVDVNYVDGQGKTALHYAAASGQLGAAQVLLENKALVDTKTKEGLTPLLIAARARDVAMVELFADRGANVNVQDELGSTPLIFAASEGDSVLARVLLRHGSQIDAKDKNGYTALMFAVLNDDAALVSELVRSGANKDLMSMTGKRAQDLVKVDGSVADLGYFEVKEAAPSSAAEPEASQIDDAQDDSRSESSQLTRLRARRPEGVFINSSNGLKLKSAHAEVRNVGSVKADNIQVYLILPGGVRVKMSGPSTLRRNAEAIYVLEQDTQMTREGRLRVDLLCDNCRR